MKRMHWSIGLLLAISWIVSACTAGQITANTAQPVDTMEGEHQSDAAGAQNSAEDTFTNTSNVEQEPTVTFKLVTGVEGGHMVFFGSGGTLDGATNPDLVVKKGDVVEIVLENGDGILHNLALEGYNVMSDSIVNIGGTTRILFTADQEGVFPYFCAIPGHRQAGMEGRLIVGEGVPEQDVTANLPSVSLAPDQVPAALTRTSEDRVVVNLETTEVEARLSDGSSYTFWTFNNTVPGPMIRVRVGDTVEVHLKNAAESMNAHSIDFHAATGPGGGAVYTQAKPGEEKSFTFKALHPGVYVYHCATPSVAHHISNGMYGLIVVEPEGGLPPVDREFYVMQGEIYTAEAFGQKGALSFSEAKLRNEAPEYLIFNGSVGALTNEFPLTANVGETVRIFFGVGGPNMTSSFHVIGEIFDRVYNLGSLTSEPLTDVQSVLVPTGGSAVVEFKLDVPGRFTLVDHSLSRAERGLVGYLIVEGEEAPEIFHGEGDADTSGH